jgi:hypothetical protein
MRVKIDKIMAGGNFGCYWEGQGALHYESFIAIHSVPTSRSDLFRLLHEFGHHHWIGIRGRRFDLSISADIMEDETLAWGYALRCIKKKLKASFMHVALSDLGSYAVKYAPEMSADQLIESIEAASKEF